MASKTIDVLNAVKAILEANATLSAYNQEVFLGVRQDVPKAQFPCIMIEVASEGEIIRTLTKRPEVKLTLVIAAIIQNVNFNDTLTGSGSYKGILQFVADIKNALDTYRDLNYDATVARVDRFEVRDTKYVFETYPFRSAEITMDCYKLLTGATSR